MSFREDDYFKKPLTFNNSAFKIAPPAAPLIVL